MERAGLKMALILRSAVFRDAEYPQSSFPKRFRASTVGYSYWCDEIARHRVLGLVPETEPTEWMETGTIGHKILEETMGQRFPWERKFMDELKEFQDEELGFVRKIRNTKIYHNLTGHPDDLQITIDRVVSTVENKFVKNTSLYYIRRWKLPMAKFQSQIYNFILEPLVQKLGGVVNRFHAVSYYDIETFQHVQDFTVPYYAAQTRTDLLRFIKVCHKPELAIKPREWKCKHCPEAHKEICQFASKQ